ncbi:MAG: hypothetical protein WAX69_00735, partial [Victivallales bacterium]
TVSAEDEGAKTDKPAVVPVKQDKPQMPPRPTMAKPEMIEAQVLKVYSSEDDGARFKAYVVKWKDAEVVVTDPMGTSAKKEGDTIKVAVMRMEMPGRGKMIRFMLAEGMPGMKKSDSKEVILKTPEAPAPAPKPATPAEKSASAD